MIPTFQYYTNSMIPYPPVFNVGGQQYFQSIPFLNYTSLQNSGVSFYKFNIFQGTSVSTQSQIKSKPIRPVENQQKLESSTQNIQNNTSDFTKKNSKTSFSRTLKKALNDHEEQNKRIRKKITKNKVIKVSQNRNRNIVPSIVQQIFSYLSKPNKSGILVDKIFSMIQKPDTSSISIRRYYYFIKHIKQKLNHYLNTNSMSILWTVQSHFLEVICEQEQLFYLNVARRVTKHFLDNLLPLLIIHSKRMFQDKRVQHLKVRRLLLDTICQYE